MHRRSELFCKFSAVCFFLLSLALRAVAADNCILIDTDADLDDYRAIATLASGKDVVHFHTGRSAQARLASPKDRTAGESGRQTRTARFLTRQHEASDKAALSAPGGMTDGYAQL